MTKALRKAITHRSKLKNIFHKMRAKEDWNNYKKQKNFFLNLLRNIKEDYNLGQEVGDKLMKLSKIGFSMEWFTAGFLQFFTKKCQNLAFGWRTGYSPSNPSISGIFWKFPNFLRS